MALADEVVSLAGVWTWFNDPRAVYDSTSDTLFFGEIGTAGVVSVSAWDYTSEIMTWGHPGGVVTLETDDHNNPALCVLSDGTVLCCYSQHNGDSYSARSANVRDIRTWDTPVALASGATDDAYAHVFQMGDTAGTVYWFFRRATQNRWFRTSTNGGASWASATEFISGGGQRPYLIAAKNGTSRIDFCISTGQPNETANSLYHFYMTVASDGTRAYYKTDDTLIGDDTDLPLVVGDMTQVYDGTTNDGWQWDIAIIGGNPVITYATFESTNTVHRYHQARWSGSAWESDEITTGGTTATADYLYSSEQNYSGGICLDPNDINTVYLSREYGSADFRLEKWTHTGTWPSGTWAKDSDVSGSTGTVNIRPYCPRGLSPTVVMWAEGSYTSYTSYAMRLRVDPAPAWRKAKPVSPSYTSSYAAPGTGAYFLFHEGSGSTVADLVSGNDGSVTGTPTWNAGDAGDFGSYMTGWSTSNYINIDTLAAAFPEATVPQWIAVLLKDTTTGTTQGFLVGLGNSASNNAVFGATHHTSAATNVGGFWRNDVNAGGNVNATAAGVNDGEFHVIWVQRESGGTMRIRMDGTIVTVGATATGTQTIDRGAIGALRRAAVSGPAFGEIHAVVMGWGTLADYSKVALDLLHGQFSGTFDPDAGGGGGGAGPLIGSRLLHSRLMRRLVA